MLKATLSPLVFFILYSCSTNWGSFFSSSKKVQENNDKMMNEFEVSQDVKKKFEEVAIKKEEPVKVSKQEGPLKEIKNTKSKKVQSQSLKPINPYPDNYPKEHQELHEITKKFWKDFSYAGAIGEETYMDINYLGVTAGKIVLKIENDTNIGGKDSFHFHARLKSAPFYRYIYELDDTIDSYVEKENFIPLKFSLIQRESSQDIDDLELFDHDKRRVYWFWKRIIKDKEKKNSRDDFSPMQFQDPLSVVFFIRGLPLVVGSKYEIPIVNKGRVEILTIEPEKIEEISTVLGKHQAIKVKAFTKYTGDTLKSGDMTFWFSQDKDKHFLKFKAKIKLGSISGDLTKLVAK